jgi:hypothetical protein
MDSSSYTEAVTLYYVSKPRDIHLGLTSAGGALSATLDANYAKKIASYYNNMVIEDLGVAGASSNVPDTITGYTNALVATVSGTWAASHYYGLVSELPEALHNFIARRATILMRLTYPSLEKPTAFDLKMFQDDLWETVASLLGTTHMDEEIGEIFK